MKDQHSAWHIVGPQSITAVVFLQKVNFALFCSCLFVWFFLRFTTGSPISQHTAKDQERDSKWKLYKLL